MSARKDQFLKLLCLAPLVVLGVAEAAAPFNPDLVNTSTYEIQPVGYVGSPVASGYRLDKGQQVLYTVDYSSQDWSGNLHAYNISTAGVVSTTETGPAALAPSSRPRTTTPGGTSSPPAAAPVSRSGGEA